MRFHRSWRQVAGCGILGLWFFSPLLAEAVEVSKSNPLRRLAIAEAWVPTVYHDIAHEFTEHLSGFNPVDNLVDIFFDGNRNLRDNGENAFMVPFQKGRELVYKAPVYYSVIETESHYYINYIFYHALDMGAGSHSHDTENIWTVVEKDGSSAGKLIAQVGNSHGFPMIYSPSIRTQDAWREKVPKGWLFKYVYYLDSSARKHHLTGMPEYISRDGSFSFKAFMISKSHAIYKLNEESCESGIVIYAHEFCFECQETADQIQVFKSIRQFELIDWDQVFSENFLLADADTSSDLFVWRDDPKGIKASMKVRKDFPHYLAPGDFEEEVSANLFYRTSFKTPFYLGDPVKVHKFFAGNDENISENYLHNPYLEGLH